jgi:FAD/FMN-containing dehydrogenase
MVVLSNPDGADPTCRDLWGPPGDGAAVMRAIKDRFDPQGVLNPGRFVY